MYPNKIKLHKNQAVLTKIIDSNAVVFFLSDEYDDSLKREVYIFNDTGTKIWEFINGKNNLEDILRKVCLEYDTTLQEAEEHIKKFIDKLVEKKLIINPLTETV